MTSPQAVTSSNQVTFSPLANDTGSDLTLQAPNAWSWKGGQVVLSGKQLNYTPAQGFTGQDKIWYVIEDAEGRTNWSVITINVSESTTAAPIANPDTVMVNASNQVTFSPLANDTGSDLTLQAPNAWSWKGGQVVLSGKQLNYTPAQGFTGQDKIWYVIEDTEGRTNWGVITINVSESTAAAPVANPDTVTVVTTDNQVALGSVYYIHNNHLGTPEVITDQQQSVVWRANYTPYGEAHLTTEVVSNNIRLPGQYFDEETGLHYNYFRYYDPTLGRYVTSDPIGLGGGVNTYGYVGGNPVRFVDPLGLNPALTAPARIGWATGGAINTVTNWAFGMSLSTYIGMTTYDWLHPENVVVPLPFNPNIYNESGEGESCDVAIDSLTDGLAPETDKRGRPTKGKYNNPDGDAQSDLDSLPGEMAENGQKILPDGSRAGLHGSTTTGRPTLHIHRPKGKQDIKIRY